MQMLLFPCSFFLFVFLGVHFSFLGSVLYVFFLFFFLSKSPKKKTNVTLCFMNVCVLIYLWFAKMKI